MSPPSIRPLVRRAIQICFWLAAWGTFVGCAILRCPSDDHHRALRSVPAVPGDHGRPDRALVAAFFAAHGIRLTPGETERIIAPTAREGRMDRNALRNIARDHNRVLLAVKADDAFLWDSLAENRPLLVLLPPGTTFSAAATPVIPIAWNRTRNEIELLDGEDRRQLLAESDFFSRREPLKQAALCLVRPGTAHRLDLTREQKLLLADFWFHRGFYRRAETAYAQVVIDPQADVEALLGQGNVLIRRGRYQDAIPVFQAALALDPHHPRVLNNLAYAMLHGDGELMTALRYVNQALQLEPDNPIILETAGSINLKLGDAPAAAQLLERAWARAQNHSPEVQMAIMDQLVRAWFGCHRRDLAWQVAEHRRRIFPDSPLPKDILREFPALIDVPTVPSPRP